tara:strand:+ start:258 stop:422 length:165 start_codon:yes stop_codon:yes gene_type:complete
MVSKLTVLQVLNLMTDEDFSFLQENEPASMLSLCNALSIEIQELKENTQKNYAN